MNGKYDVSVILCTYNRCELLPSALKSIFAQDAGDIRFEVIVVDNNSTDQTRDVVESFASDQPDLRYIFESKQGLSHARNAGIMVAKASILALTDDDLCVQPEWIAEIHRAFHENPDVMLVGSRILPEWESEPPTWLTEEHWAPLALIDKDAPFKTNAKFPFCLIGISIRRELFDRIGFFSPELLKIGASSCEDHEFQLRMWQAGFAGLYDPGVLVIAPVQRERMTKEYHRLWHSGHGKSMAIIGLQEVVDADGHVVSEPRQFTRLFGVPAPVYRELCRNCARWLASLIKGNESRTFSYEMRVRDSWNYINATKKLYAGESHASPTRELIGFVKRLLQSKLRRLKNPRGN